MKEEMTLNAALEMNSLLLNRLSMMGKTHGGDRDLYEVLGYKRTLTAEDYRDRFDRGDISNRIATAYPSAVWSNPPSLTEDTESKEETQFTKDMKKLFRKKKLWFYLNRADTLAQLGRFSVLLLGISDNKELKDEAGKGELAYLMPYGEDAVEIKEWENDPKNARFGKPKLYSINIGQKNAERGESTTVIPSIEGGSLEVHWSRIIHIADRALDSDVFGSSIFQHIFNRLQDLDKVAGGGSESFWMNARGGIHMNFDKDVEIDDKDSVKDKLKEYQHKLSRFLLTKGAKVENLQADVADPSGQFEALMSLISGATGIPKRILMGSERGELSSSQDETNWNNRVDERRVNFCEPCILDQLLERLVAIGFITLPIGKELEDMEWAWPALNKQSDKDRATTAKDTAAAIATYANSPEAEMIIPPRQFVEEVVGIDYSEEDIEKMLEDEENELDDEDEIKKEEDDEEVIKLPVEQPKA